MLFCSNKRFRLRSYLMSFQVISPSEHVHTRQTHLCFTRWEHPEPGEFASPHQHPAPRPHRHQTPPLLPHPKGLASAHACEAAWEWLFVWSRGLGRSERAESWLHEFVMSAMLAMAYWTGEGQRSLGEKRPTESDRDPGPPGSARAATDPSLASIDRLILPETVTDSSMRTRGRTTVIPSRSNRFMLHLFI